ncbi:MAG TPA: bifunctional oligoribonuclease/PAP phosphatase NrnA [Clostridiaceae bacterium]|nr:bifunctional oligoribonuclease/PAP phosphatase NrnA [Clostridiaceae bacterium]
MILIDIINILRESKKVYIMPHVSVDGDGLGSSIALGLALEKIGTSVEVWLEEDVPSVYSFLPGSKLIRVYNGEVDLPREDIGTVVALDAGDLARLGKRVEIFNNAEITINIDHHNTNDEFAQYNYVNVTSSSVGEILYQLIKMMGIEFDRDIATCLYVAISTDTGGFRYSNTTSVTHQIAGDLLNSGVNVADVSQKVFDTVSYEKVMLMGAAINSLELFENGKIAFITISDDVMMSTGAKEEDCDGIVNIGRNIRGVEVAVMMRSRSDGELKVNLRSNSYVNVSEIAKLYSGGGHKRAAGCTVKGNIEDIKSKLLDDIRKVL